MNAATQSFVSLLASGCLLALTAAPPSIGVIRSDGDFQVDGATVRGNATVFDGSTVQTTSAQSKIRLSGGSEIVMAPTSRVQIYRDRTVFESGRVSIAATQGLMDVRNGAGVLVATVRPGLSLAFSMQEGGAATASKMSGCLVAKNGKFLLTDSTSNVTVELQGPDVAKSAGHQVEISGSMIPGGTPAPGASQVVQVVTVDSVGAACNGAAAGGAKGGAAAATGLSMGAKIAIVGGVAVAGTVGGLAAAGTFNSQSPASRP